MRLVFSAMVAASLTACATSSPDVIQPDEAQRMSQVYDATVLSVRPVTVDGSQSGIGTVAGAVTGGVAAHRRDYRERLAAGVLGAVLGGVIGNAIERGRHPQNAVEMLMQLRNGERALHRPGRRQRGWMRRRTGRARHDRRSNPRDARAAGQPRPASQALSGAGAAPPPVPLSVSAVGARAAAAR